MPIPSAEGNISSQSVKDIVYRKLKEWIIEGVLEPGEKISEKELAAYFNVSKTPVREAIQMLETQMLVKTYPRKETIVAPIKTDNIEEWYIPIIALEECAVREACKNVTEEELKGLEELNAAIDRCSESEDPLEIMRRDRAFHDEIVRIANNRYISDFLELLQMHIQRLEYMFFKNSRAGKKKYPQMHLRIIQAMREQDADSAAALMKEHWLTSMEEIKDLLKNDE